jgi:hypothetical protein
MARYHPSKDLPFLYSRIPFLTYLTYEDFDTVAHPYLLLFIHVPLADGRGPVIRRERSDNPPILHRRELLVDPAYPFFPAISAAYMRRRGDRSVCFGYAP